MVLLGFRYLASSIPLICLAGVAIGVGVIFAFLVLIGSMIGMMIDRKLLLK